MKIVRLALSCLLPLLAVVMILSLLQLTTHVSTAVSDVAPAARLAQITPDVRFVDSSGTPLADQALWLFCYDASDAANLLSQQWIQTDGNGRLATPLPTACPWLAVLLEQLVQPSGKAGHGPAYWVFAASWPTGSGVPTFADDCANLLCAANGDVVIRQAWPLVLFNVVASLEWEPEAGSAYVAELTAGLQQASAYLADLTDGYMAFGPIAIQTGGVQWEGADLRFHAANDLRPAAFVGGIVNTPTVYTPPGFPVLSFRPAAVLLGRAWNRANAYTGAWNAADGYRTLVHEWAHYALFLNDEYQDPTGARIYCTRQDLPALAEEADYASAMAWHYVASELWHLAHGQSPAGICEQTDQFHAYGQSDWETLVNWAAIQGLSRPTFVLPSTPQATLAPDERAILANLFGHVPTARFRLHLPFVATTGIPPAAPIAHTLRIRTSDTPSLTPTQSTQVYLLHTTALSTTQILHQGTPVGGGSPLSDLGKLTLLGVGAADDFRIFVDRYAFTPSKGDPVLGQRFLYPSDGAPADLTAEEVVAQSDGWGSSLDLRYGVSRQVDQTAKLTRLTVVLTGPRNGELLAPTAQLCAPDVTIGCPTAWRQAMRRDTNGAWLADFTPLPGMAEFPLYGVAQITDNNPKFDGLIRWFRDGGGVGPGHKLGGAPTSDSAPVREGPATVQAIDAIPLEGDCNRLMLMPATNYAALLTAPDPDVRIVGMPLDLDILLGATGSDQVGPLCNSRWLRALRLTLFYNQASVDQLGLTESNLKLFHYESGPGWKLVGPATVDPDLNWVATTIITDGIYAIGWQP